MRNECNYKNSDVTVIFLKIVFSSYFFLLLFEQEVIFFIILRIKICIIAINRQLYQMLFAFIEKKYKIIIKTVQNIMV